MYFLKSKGILLRHEFFLLFRAVPLRAGDSDVHPGLRQSEAAPLPLHRMGLPPRHRHHVGITHLRHRRQGRGGRRPQHRRERRRPSRQRNGEQRGEKGKWDGSIGGFS